ncbi:MAG: glycosyltransferase family 2 protein [Nanobdellota archaeon]
MTSLVNPQISVLMSVYNGERYISRAIMSILAQTYADFELILVDDGSTDGTAELINKIQDDRLKFYQQENVGLTKTMNRALSLAKGRLIARHDADDFSIVTRFEKQVEFLGQNQEVGLVGTSCFIQPARHCVINEVYDYPELHDEIVKAFVLVNPFVHGSMMMRRELLEACGGYNEEYRYVQDYELWSRLLSKTQVHNLKTPLYVRSVHSRTSQVSVDKTPIFEEIRTKFMKNNHSLFPQEMDEVRLVASMNFYPFLARTGSWNRSIATTFYRMGVEAKKYGLPWYKLRGQSFIYSFV